MRKPTLKLKVIQRGTHMLPLKEINNDVPTPPQVVADILADVECRLFELIKAGGCHPPVNRDNPLDSLCQSMQILNDALLAATEQNWKLELQLNPNEP